MQSELQSVVVHMGAVDASGTPLAFWRAPIKCVINSIHLVTSSAVAAHATDIHTSTVTNLGSAGSGSTTVATQTTDSDVSGSAAITAKVPWPLTLSETAAALEVAEGDVLQIAPTEGGTATSGDLADAAYTISYYPGAGIGA